MRKDIDYVDCDGEGLIYDEDWLTPSLAKGEYRYRKLDLSTLLAFTIASKVVTISALISCFPLTT